MNRTQGGQGEDSRHGGNEFSTLANIGLSRRGLLKAMLGISGIAGSAAILSGCAFGERFGASRGSVTGGEVARRGEPATDDHQVLRTAMWTDPTSHDWNRSVHAGGIPELFAPLLTLDVNFDVQPWAAEKWQVSTDGTKYLIGLRKDAMWTNGQPVTADDWVYSFTRMLSPATKAPQAPTYFDIVGAEDFNLGKSDDVRKIGLKAIDRFTLEFSLRQPVGHFPMLLALWGSCPAYQSSVEKFGDNWTEPDLIVGNGPFKLSRWEHGNHLIIERRSDWWSALPKPKLREVHYNILSPDQAIDAYQDGEVDLIPVPSGQFQTAMGDAQLQQEMFLTPLFSSWYLIGETSQKPFDDVRVRQALQRAVDRDLIASKVLQGLGRAAYDVVHPGFLGFSGNDDDLQQAQGFDPKAAIDILHGTPYEGGKNWPHVTLMYDAGRDSLRSRPAAEAIKQMLGRYLNLLVELEPIDKQQLQERMKVPPDRRGIQLAFLSWSPDYPHPQSYANGIFYGGRSLRRHSWSDGWVDFQIANAAKMTDQKEASLIYAQVERRALVEQAALTPVMYTYGGTLVKPNVHGLALNRDGEFMAPNNFYRTALSRDLYIAKA
jgi:oligopeptide transport system substrate-binding protein